MNELITLQLSRDERPLDLTQLKLPFVIKHKPLISPGVWNGYYISADLIKRVYEKTDWNAKEIRSLYLDHQDTRTADWVGEVDPKSIEFDEKTGMIYADLIIVDPATAIKLAYGAKFGISPSLSVLQDNHVLKDFSFRNFAVVVQPAMTTNYINNALSKEGGDNMEDEKMLEVLEGIAKEVKSLRADFEKFKKEIDAEYDVTPEELLELAKIPAFSEFYKKYKEKYPNATMEDAAKAYKKLKKKYPEEAEMKKKKKDKEKYKYPDTEGYPEEMKKKKKKKEEEYPYPEKMNKKANFEEESEEQKEEQEEKQEPEPESEPKPEEKSEENKQKESQSETKPESKEEPKNESNNDEISALKARIKELEEMVAKSEKPVVDSPAGGEAVVQKIEVNPNELFAQYVKKIEGGG